MGERPETESVYLAMRGIEDLIARRPDLSRLAPLRRLASEFEVSEWTMRRALDVLRERGTLIYRRGSAIMIAGRPAPCAARVSSEEKLFGRLRDQISHGRLRVGMALPKALFLAKRERISRTTIARVNRRLVSEGLAHRSGKSVIVGAAPRARARTGSLPVILVVVSRRGSWQRLDNQRTHAFIAAFTEHAQHHGIRIQLAVHRAHPGDVSLFIEGRNEARATARKLGHRYLGTLVMLPRTMGEEVNEWIKALLPFRKPVVWFDRNGDNLEKPIVHPAFVRCRHMEDRGLRACLRYLLDCGHRKVLYPFFSGSDWERKRYEQLDTIAGSSCPDLTVLAAPSLTPEYWETPGSVTSVRLLRKLRAEKIGAVNAALSAVLEDDSVRGLTLPRSKTRSERTSALERFVAFSKRVLVEKHAPDRALMHRAETVWGAMQYAEIIFDRSISCFIAPNDSRAALIMGFLMDIRYPVPSRIGLIGFDNAFLYSNFPITSIDWGFGGLGYAAFHAILGDIPVKRERDGSVAADPQVVDRGTVASVRSR